MKRRALIWIILTVVTAHGVFFWWVSDKKPLPERAYIPPPNFRSAEAIVVDPETGEKTIYREFTVSTKLEERSH